MKKVYAFVIACMIGITTFVQAQNLDYQFSSGTSSYTDLSSPTYLAQSSAWNPSYKIPLGFSFNCMGQLFDSVQVFTNGYLVFDNNFNHAFAAFALNMSKPAGGSLTAASISYALEGGSGSHILKVQFKDCEVAQQDSGVINFQVWLYEGSNKIELLVGSNSYSSTVFSNLPKMIGPVNMNPLKPGQNAFVLHGSSNSPAAGSISGTNVAAGSSNLSDFPAANTLYTFTPNF